MGDFDCFGGEVNAEEIVVEDEVGDLISEFFGEFRFVNFKDVEDFGVFIFEDIEGTDEKCAGAAGGVNDFYVAEFFNSVLGKGGYSVFFGCCIDLVEANAEVSFEKFDFFIGDFADGVICDEAGEFGRGIVYAAFFSFGGFSHFGVGFSSSLIQRDR